MKVPDWTFSMFRTFFGMFSGKLLLVAFRVASLVWLLIFFPFSSHWGNPYPCPLNTNECWESCRDITCISSTFSSQWERITKQTRRGFSGRIILMMEKLSLRIHILLGGTTPASYHSSVHWISGWKLVYASDLGRGKLWAHRNRFWLSSNVKNW